MMIIIAATKYYNSNLVAMRRDAPVVESGTLRTLEIRDISSNLEPPAAPVINM
jgi:hypothetical protein